MRPSQQPIVVEARRPELAEPDQHRGVGHRLVDPAGTLQIIEEAIERQRFIEDEADLIAERAQNLLGHIQAERARLHGQIETLRSDLASQRRELMLVRERLAEADHRARLAERRAERSETRNEELTSFCVQIVDAVAPFLGETSGLADKEALLAFLQVVDLDT